MGYVFKNENPLKKMVDDCVIRALVTVTGKSWDDIASELFVEQLKQKDLQNANSVWSVVLEKNGFEKKNLPCTYSSCYTVRQFASEHPHGIYVLGDGSHAVACVDGYYVDTYDSGDRTVLFYFQKER